MKMQLGRAEWVVAWAVVVLGGRRTWALRLRYFDARGAAETTRVMLKYAGTEFVDERWSIDFAAGFKSEGFEAARRDGALDANLKRAPVLVVDGQVIGQSKAIERYAARLCGVAGESDVEWAKIDAVAEHVRDVAAAQRLKGFSAFVKDKSDEDKAKLKKEWFDDDLPAWLAKIEAVVGDAGFAVGTRRSYADFCLWGAFLDTPRNGPDSEIAARALESAPNIHAICLAVDAEPAVQAWLADRPSTRF